MIDAGDVITASVTHEIKINGDKSWVKFELATMVQPGETETHASARATEVVNRQVLETIKATVEAVNSVSKR